VLVQNTNETPEEFQNNHATYAFHPLSTAIDLGNFRAAVPVTCWVRTTVHVVLNSPTTILAPDTHIIYEFQPESTAIAFLSSRPSEE